MPNRVAEIQQESPIFTLRQAAAYLQVSRTHMLSLLKGKSGTRPLRHTRAGRRILIKRAWIDAWLDQESKGGLG